MSLVPVKVPTSSPFLIGGQTFEEINHCWLCRPPTVWQGSPGLQIEESSNITWSTGTVPPPHRIRMTGTWCVRTESYEIRLSGLRACPQGLLAHPLVFQP